MKSRHVDELARLAIDTAFHIHKDLGPGLLESAYELIMFEKLIARGVEVERQVPVNISYSGIRVDNAFKVDLLLERQLVVELKAVDAHVPVHARQLLTYLKLMKLPVGLLINFGMETLKDGVRRLANNHTDLAP